VTIPLRSALVQVAQDLRVLDCRWALVGGLAVAVRAEPRTTRDVDIAVAVRDDAEAEELIRKLVDLGYRVEAQLEQTAQRRLAAVRLLPPGADPEGGLLVDLSFAVSGIEREVVEGAEGVSVIEGLDAPVAATADLLALKVLAESPERVHDRHDARALIARLNPEEIAQTQRLLGLITQRGFARGKDLRAALDGLIDEQAKWRFEG
jgi:predicted nucleotidyltransferase